MAFGKMKKALSGAVSAILLLGFAPFASAASPVRVSISADDVDLRRPFEGWGTSLCWWAEQLGGIDGESRLKISKAFFSDEGDGLGLNIVRYNIGAGDDPDHTHLNNGRGMPVWVDEDGGFNPDADPNQLAFLKDAVSMGADIVECFSNSPPYYMTESGCSSGGKDKNTNNISPDSFDAFAEYLATVTAYIQNELGIKVDSLEPMNEPCTDYWGYEGSQEGCHIDAADHSALIAAVHNALAAHGLEDVDVTAADENNMDNMARYLDEYTDEALALISRLNVHSYGGGYAKIKEKAAELGKKLYMSEVDGDGSIGYDAGNMGPALWFSQKVTDDMNNLRPDAWILWQLSTVAYPASHLDSGYWNLTEYDLKTDTLTKFKKYYAYAHYTKFIKEGDYLLSSDNSSVLAARNYDTGKVALVITNSGKRAQTYEVALSALDGIGESVSVYRTDSERSLEKLDGAASIENKILTVDIPKSSITTVVIENETPSAAEDRSISLEIGAGSCFPNDELPVFAEGEGVSVSAVGGEASETVFKAGERGTAVVTAKIDGSDIYVSKRIDIVDDGDTVRLVNLESGLALKESGEGYVQEGDSDSAYQYWKISRKGSILTFKNLRSGNFLSDGDGNTEWTAEPYGGGYALINTATGNALDVFNHSTSEGSRVGTYEFGGGGNQLWNFSLGGLEPALDALAAAEPPRKIEPVSIDGTASYGGNEDVSFEKAFDGDVETHHDAWDGDNSYLSAEMPEGEVVTLIRFYPRVGFVSRMYGGSFYGVKNGEETLLCTLGEDIQNGWNDIYIDNSTQYDSIIYRTPKGGLCNVAELEYLSCPLSVSLSCEDGLRVELKNHSSPVKATLMIIYRNGGEIAAVNINTIGADEFARVSENFALDANYESADVYVMLGTEIISSGYVYLKNIYTERT